MAKDVATRRARSAQLAALLMLHGWHEACFCGRQESTTMKKTLFVLMTMLMAGSAAHAFSAPQPTPKQQAQVKRNLVAQAKRTSFYKGLAKDGGKPNISVSFSNPATTIPGFIGNGFRAATVTIRSIDLADTRSYNVVESGNGKFRAVAEGKWATTAQPIGPLVK
jgi:hypothetical protein